MTAVSLPALAVTGLLAPVVAGLMAKDRLDRARAWLLAWCAIQVTTDLLALMSGAHGRYTWLDGPVTALTGGAVLWALSLWQRQALAELTLRLAVPLFVIVAVALTAIAGPRIGVPLVEATYALLGLGVAIYTLASHAGRHVEHRLHADGLWAIGGLAVFFAGALAVLPFESGMTHGGGAGPGHGVPSLAQLVASVMLTIGVLCPLGGAHSRVLSRFT